MNDTIVFGVILVVAFALLITERLRNDLVAVLAVLALTVTGLLEPAEALSGFGSEPAIVLAAILVLSAALRQTGVSEIIGSRIGRLAGGSLTRAIAVIMPSVALLSAFTHHVTTTAVMLPVTLNFARERGIAASKLLMPLSFAASLGTTITLVGAPAFLMASAILQQAGRPGLGIFSIAPIGLALSATGTLFVLLVGRWLLPARKGAEDTSTQFRLDEYFTELTVLPDSPLVGKTIEDAHAEPRYQFQVVGLVRRGQPRPRPSGSQIIEARDVLLVRTTPEQLLAIRGEPGIELHPLQQYQSRRRNGDAGDDADDDDEGALVQAVIAPGSDLVGRTLGDVDFHRRYGAIVLGLWRQAGWLEGELARIRLRGGDVLVLQGDDAARARVGNDAGFLMLVPFPTETRLRRKATVAAAVMLATIALAASGWISLEIATLAGAAAMVLTGCLTMGRAYRAIDARIYVFIAGAIPLGTAMKTTGTAELVAGWLERVVQGWHESLVLLVLFAVVGVATQFMSDAATTALFGPVAVSLAQGLGHAPEAFVVTVAMAAVASFLTPIGHHGNLIVYGPGGYQFWDFVRVGTPLTVIVALEVALLAPLLWPR
jgi:di/tricarboxylate transporter